MATTANPPAQTREEFLAERTCGVGGSDVAAVFNVGYGCALKLWREKRGEKPDYPREESGPMKLGNWLEPHIADEYARLTGREVRVRGVAHHPDHPELLVHIDREIIDPAREGPGVLEIKALGRAMFYKVKREGILEDYILQVNQGMLVKGYTWGAFAVMNRDNGDLIYWDVERDEALCELILQDGVAFWGTVENGPAPEMLEPDDKRCGRCEYRRSCQGAALIQIEGGSEIEQDESLRPLLAEYDERRALAEEADGILDETKEALKTAMGARGAVECGGRKVYYRPQVSNRIDSKAFDTCYPDLVKHIRDLIAAAKQSGVPEQPIEAVENRLTTYGNFKRPSESRPLRVY